jgi:hypothetical protein
MKWRPILVPAHCVRPVSKTSMIPPGPYDSHVLCILCTTHASYPTILTGIEAALFQPCAKSTCGLLAIASCLLSTAEIQFSVHSFSAMWILLYRQFSHERRLRKVIGESGPLPGDISTTSAIRCRRIKQSCPIDFLRRAACVASTAGG